MAMEELFYRAGDLVAFALNFIVAKTVEKLLKEVIKPSVWMSVSIPGGGEYNRQWILKYKHRVKSLRGGRHGWC